MCHPDLFDKYFTLTVADDDLSQAELDSLLARIPDVKKFTAACEAFKKRGLLNLVLERLDAYKELIPLEDMPSLTQALCDMSDGFPHREQRSFGQMFEHDMNAYAWRLCYFGLKREPDKKKRFQIVNEAIIHSTGIALPFELVSLDDQAAKREGSEHEFLLEEADVEVLKKVCAQKFRQSVKRSNFRQSGQFRLSLLRWGAWESAEERKSLMKCQIRTPTDALWLLTVLLGESHSYGEDHRVRYSITLGLLEHFIDIGHLTELMTNLKSDKLTKRETIALREFTKAVKRRAEGKPDNVGDVMRDQDEEIVE
ncbi:MAG: hypothetical protein RL514_4553 [Verrucomicrobiota bacterium]